jgi:hypothetical protein
VSQILFRRLCLITCGYFFYCNANRLRKRRKPLWRSIGTGSLQMKHNLFGWEFLLFSALLVLLTNIIYLYALQTIFCWVWNHSCCYVVVSFGILERYQLKSTMISTRKPSMSSWIPWPPHTSLQRYVCLHLIGFLTAIFWWFNIYHHHQVMVGVSHNMRSCFCLDNMRSCFCLDNMCSSFCLDNMRSSFCLDNLWVVCILLTWSTNASYLFWHLISSNC